MFFLLKRKLVIFDDFNHYHHPPHIQCGVEKTRQYTFEYISLTHINIRKN